MVQQNGAPPHQAEPVSANLDKIFRTCLIGRWEVMKILKLVCLFYNTLWRYLQIKVYFYRLENSENI